MKRTIAFIGAGAITEALLKGMCQTGAATPANIAIVNRQNTERRLSLARLYNVHPCETISEAVAHAEIIFLCIKPKDVAESLAEVARYARPEALYISVAAGCSIAWMTDLIMQFRPAKSSRSAPLPAPRLIRTMPNTSCAVLESATAYALGPTCTERDADNAQALLSAVGQCYRMEESKLDAVTGLSGSGPAYFYYLVESLTKAGVEVGLDVETATALVTQTLIGAAAMLQHSAHSPTHLRERVTSPGGTTMAGLTALREYGFTEAVCQAVSRATERSQELGAVWSHAANAAPC